MRVVLPQLTMEDDYVHERTAMACMNKRIYKMEPIVSGVYKRSTHESLDDQSKFAVYDGKIVEVDIQNMEQVLRYENN